MKVYAHAPYIGTTGFNNHSRDFFRGLSKRIEHLKVRNYTVGQTWKGFSNTPHDDEPYLNDIDKKILYKQSLWNSNNELEDFNIYQSYGNNFEPDFHIVLNETNHYYFYNDYDKPKIAYVVWETTLQPEEFFNRLKSFDEVWVPSKWQKDCMINQGYDENKIKIVPEGIDSNVFYPEKVDFLDEYKDGRFKFLLFGRWDYRKSTKEIIETFLKTFDKHEPVDLVVSIDNPWGESMDGFKTTEERLRYYDLNDPRIKIKHFPSREDYVKYMKTGHVFVSCARSEGWNLPLIEAMACGVPSIYSDCSGQLEFAKGKGFPVKIKGEINANSDNYGLFSTSKMFGNIYEPDFDDLSKVMRNVYDNYDKCKQKAMSDSVSIISDFNWDNVAEIGYEKCVDFYSRINSQTYTNNQPDNDIIITYLDGPMVEIKGTKKQSYFVEFIDEYGNVKHSDVITNNMWTKCNIRYYVKWKIRINGEIVDELNLENETVLISMESSALGDSIAWSPYAVEFMKKHKCKVALSTFHNSLFDGKKEYDGIEFVKPGSTVLCKAIYRLGWFMSDNKFEDFNRNKTQVNIIPLQQTATDILGLDYRELNLGVNFTKLKRPITDKYVIFAPNATLGCKEWVYDYWVSLSKMLIELGYKVVTITKNKFSINDTINIWGESLQTIMNYMSHSDIFIGLGSGLSWLNWSLGKHTYMINGFTKDGHEFTSNITRITNNVCISCWNDEVFVFDKNDWDWCPVYKGTIKQHICQKSITPIQVFNVIFGKN
jgi:autotransporter strand-loop-strand O-heptosyltransferase